MISTATASTPAPQPHAGDVFAKARFNMVESQIRTNRVTDERILAAMLQIPRQLFVPGALASVAYVDKSIRVVRDRFLMEPMFLARLLQEAAVESGDKALVVGAASGYSAAILAELGASVTALECDPVLADRARTALSGLGLADITVVTGPLTEGWKAGAPYQVILIDGMIAALPPAIAALLAERGRLVAIEALDGRCGAGMLYRKLGAAVSGRPLFDASIPFLPGFEPRPVFSL
jgi:protein-L-isoaspartate(D-aspartate) O-methyltransferase